MRTSVVFGLLACAIICAAAGGESTIYDFLKGDWDIYVYKTPFATSEMPEDIESTRYVFNARNGTTQILDGVRMTEEGKERFQVRVSGAFVGEYLEMKNEEVAATPEQPKKEEPLGEDMGLKATEPTLEEKKEKDEKEEEEEEEEEDDIDLQSIFKFNFVNITEGHFVSQGLFGESSAYQAVISNGAKPSFTMTIYKIVDGKASEYTTVLAKKVLPKPQPSFMQKYGMLIMMGVMMMMNMAKTPSMAGGAAAGGEGAAAGGDGAAAAGAAAPAN